MFNKGFVAGTFDLLHVGHLYLLKECKEHCNFLIVALHVDPSIERADKNKPIESVLERTFRLKATKYVNQVLVYETEADLALILQFRKPDIRFLGSDYRDNQKQITAKELAPIEYIDSIDIHSSDIRERIKNS